jgi:ribonuclease HI
MAIIYCYSKYPSDVYTFNILGDSELVIKQITGEYAVSNPHLKSIYQKANSIASLLRNLTFKWIPREENTEADALGRELR